MHGIHGPRNVQGWYSRAFITVVGLACVAVGLLGLLLPIIPGVLFLFMAVLLFSRISPRVARWRRETPLVARLDRRVRAIGRLGWANRLRLFGWMALGGVADLLRRSAELLGRLVK